jgi:hypothetical protein
MKRNVFVAGLLVLAMVLVLAGCMSVEKWDKTATEVSTLYIEHGWSVVKLDGAGNFFLYGDKVYKGDSNNYVRDSEKPSDRDIKKLKPTLEIPSGDRTVTIQSEALITKQTKDIAYNFLPGKHYVILSSLDVDNYNVRSALVQDISVMKFEVRDITDLKVKK